MCSVQGSLVMYSILKFGSEEQRGKYLPELAQGGAQEQEITDVSCKLKAELNALMTPLTVGQLVQASCWGVLA